LQNYNKNTLIVLIFVFYSNFLSIIIYKKEK